MSRRVSAVSFPLRLKLWGSCPREGTWRIVVEGATFSWGTGANGPVPCLELCWNNLGSGSTQRRMHAVCMAGVERRLW